MTQPSRDRAGAVRDQPRRRGLGWLWALLGLLALIAIGLGLYFALRDNGTKASTPVVAATTAAASPAATDTAVAPSTASTPTALDSATASAIASDSAVSSATPTDVATSAAVGGTVVAPAGTSGGLVGGAAVAAAPATGPLAVPGALGSVLFAEGSAGLSGQADRVVNAAAAQIKANPPAAVAVTGYTDKIAGQPVNDTLSQQRADAVAAALKAALGPAGTTTITTAAKGENAPIASNDTADGRQLNRRSTITAP